MPTIEEDNAEKHFEGPQLLKNLIELDQTKPHWATYLQTFFLGNNKNSYGVSHN